jgi:hypothetical protein
MARPDAPSLEESTMKVSPGLRNSAVLVLLALLAALCWLPGCLDNLCTKRLYIYRDAEAKSPPPADTALLIADPAIVAALAPEAAAKLPRGLPWAPEQPNYASDYYQLSIDGLDDHLVYQGLCMNITPSFVCEVRPGSRRVLASLNLFGSWGRQSIKETTSLSLEPGGVYFLYPEGEAASQKTLRLKVERLPVSYTAALRAKLIDWLRRNTQGHSLEN